MTSLNLGIIGLGYWGPNLLRDFKDIQDVRVKYACDLDKNKLENLRAKYHDVYLEIDAENMIKDQSLDAIVISTPASTHYELAKAALENGKHVFLEKPMAKTVDECSSLVEIAERGDKILMIGHVYEHNTFINYLKKYISEGQLGKVEEMWATRFALGPIRSDVTALWDLASHDIGIFTSLSGNKPVSISANGKSYEGKGKQSGSVSLYLYFDNDIGGDIRVSWGAPNKIRELLVIGSKTTGHFDEVAFDRNLTFYDRGVDHIEPDATFSQYRSKIRKGVAISPFVDFKESLKEECRNFIECIKNGSKPITDGEYGMNVVRVLVAAERSLKERKIVEI